MFAEIIAKVGLELDKAEIPYMIIGGQAVLLYGEPRLTKDIDITLGVGIKNLKDVIKTAAKIGGRPLPERVEAFVNSTFVLPVIVDGSIRVDFIFSLTEYERQAIARAKRVKINNVLVNFSSIEDIIIHKIFAGRPRDIEDVKSIVLKNSDIEIEYINKWLALFEQSDEEQQFVQEFADILKDTERF